MSIFSLFPSRVSRSILCSSLFLASAITFSPCVNAQAKAAVCRDRSAEPSILGYASAKSAADIEKSQVRMYGSNDVSFTHGYAAEDANATHDRLHGGKVKQTGPSNGSDNPDRIVNGNQIQTKYCKSAYETIHTSFNKHTGMYRYPGQQLEVPKDQYEEAVQYMAKKIREGKVEGVSDPAQARKIIRKGHYTYKQSVDIAKAGTIESIKYDVKTGIVSTSIAAGLSFTIVFTNDIRSGMSVENAAKHAGKECGVTSLATISAHVITKQLLRSTYLSSVKVAIDNAGRKVVDKVSSTEIGRKTLAKVVGDVTGKETVGQAAARLGGQVLSSTAISSTCVGGVTTIPLVADGISGRKEWGDVIEDGVSNLVSIACGAAGAVAGAAIGTLAMPGAGTAAGCVAGIAAGSSVGSVVGGIAGGFAGSAASHKVFDLCSSKKKDNE